MSLESLIKDTQNSNLVIDILKSYMKDEKNCIITGQSGVGKTTLLKNLIGEIDARLSVKYCEYIPELRLETCYPDRNIISVNISEFLKSKKEFSILKCDALVRYDNCAFVIGELASDVLVYYFLEGSWKYNIINLATHHASTTDVLLGSLVNSYTSYYLDEIKNNFKESAYFQYTDILNFVLDFLNVDIHLKIYPDGIRRIERITEIRPIKEKNSNIEIVPNLPNLTFNELKQEFENRNKNAISESYIPFDIVKYDEEENRYIIKGI